MHELEAAWGQLVSASLSEELALSAARRDARGKGPGGKGLGGKGLGGKGPGGEGLGGEDLDGEGLGGKGLGGEGLGASGGADDAANAEPCDFRWVLLLEGAGPPRELLARMRQGLTVFKQASPYREHFAHLLQPWVHYVPVAENLADLPARVHWAEKHAEEAAAIGRRGRALASSLHPLELACYWWQLLTAIAPLQDYAPRGAPFGLPMPRPAPGVEARGGGP